MTDKKFYRTVFRIEVLGDESLIDESLDMKDIHEMTYEGPRSGRFLDTFEEEVTPAHMGHLLEAQGSDPQFLLGDAWPMKQELGKLEFAFKTTGSVRSSWPSGSTSCELTSRRLSCEAERTMNDVAERQGWNEATKLDLVYRFLNNLDVLQKREDEAPLDHFKRWLENKAKWENNDA